MRINEGMPSPQRPRNPDCTAPGPVEDTGSSSSCFQNTAQVFPAASEHYSNPDTG